jgi:hypothetical protein
VAGPGGGHHHRAGTGEVCPPAEIEIVAQERDAGIEPVERLEEVGPDEGARAGDGEHLADGVVLLLVQLAPLAERQQHARTVDAEPDLQERAGIVPGHELGPEDAGVGPERLLDEGPHHTRIERHVVVAQQVERGVLGLRETGVHGLAIAEPAIEPLDPGLGQHVVHPRRGVGQAAGVEDEEGEVGVGLPAKRREHLVEPRPRIVGDDHDQHAGHRADVRARRRSRRTRGRGGLGQT